MLYRKDGSSLGALGAADAGDAGDVDLLLVQVQESHPNKGLVTLPSSFSAEWSHENASPSGEPGTVPDSAWCRPGALCSHHTEPLKTVTDWRKLSTTRTE